MFGFARSIAGWGGDEFVLRLKRAARACDQLIYHGRDCGGGLRRLCSPLIPQFAFSCLPQRHLAGAY
jgi:hypothetical protein